MLAPISRRSFGPFEGQGLPGTLLVLNQNGQLVPSTQLRAIDNVRLGAQGLGGGGSQLFFGGSNVWQFGNNPTQVAGSWEVKAQGNGVDNGGLIRLNIGGESGIAGEIQIGAQALTHLTLGSAPGPGGGRIGLWGATPVEQAAPTTASGWQNYFINLGLVGPGAVFPSGGGVAGISNPAVGFVQILDATYTRLTVGGGNATLVVDDAAGAIAFNTLPGGTGITIGNSGTELIAFYGKTPGVARQTITVAQQTAINATPSAPLLAVLINLGIVQVI